MKQHLINTIKRVTESNEDLVVLDYSDGNVYWYKIGLDEDVTDILKENGHNLVECSWMIHSNIVLHLLDKK